MNGQLCWIHWDRAAARARAEELRSRGWDIDVESRDGGKACCAIRKNPPDVVLIDLSVKPSHGIETARSLRETRWGEDLRVIFLDGSPADQEKARTRVADATFARWAGVDALLPTAATSPAPAPPRRNTPRRTPASPR